MGQLNMHVTKADAAQLLANEIVRVAADDYEAMLCGHKLTNTSLELTHDFFESEFYQMLTNIDGKKLRDALEAEVKSVNYDYRKLLKLKQQRRAYLQSTAGESNIKAVPFVKCRRRRRSRKLMAAGRQL